MISSLLTTVAVAAVDTNKAAREGISDVIYQVKNDTSYVEPKNTFDDNSPTYYYVTTDAAETSGTSKTVTKDKKTYTAKVIKPTDDKLSTLKDGGTTIFKENATIFFAEDNYSDDVRYYDFSKDNLSMVGLDNKDNIIITRVPASYYDEKILERRGI